jgi:hypothetical protein
VKSPERLTLFFTDMMLVEGVCIVRLRSMALFLEGWVWLPRDWTRLRGVIMKIGRLKLSSTSIGRLSSFKVLFGLSQGRNAIIFSTHMSCFSSIVGLERS